MDNKTKLFLKVIAVSTITFMAVIFFNYKRNKSIRTQIYQPSRVFGVVVSEEQWDESMMPKGKRSPKGVLYNPEK